MPQLKVYYVQEHLGNRVIWTSEPMTRENAKTQAKEMNEKSNGETQFLVVRTYEG